MNGHNTEILGYFGYQNAGDDAFHDFWRRGMGAPATALAKSLRGRRVRSAILGGGAIVNDYFLSRLPAAFDSLSLYGCSLPFGDDDVQRLAPLADRIAAAQFRSRRDAAAAQALLPQARYVPDLIFGHDFEDVPMTIEQLLGCCEVPPARVDPERKNLVLLLSDHYRAAELGRYFSVEAFKYRLADALDYLTQFYNVICIPLSMWHDSRDNVFAADVVSKMARRELVAVVDRYLGPDRIYGAIKSLGSLVVTMKYHGIVFAMHAGVPFVNIGDTRKNTDLLMDADLAALGCGFEGFDKERFLDAVKAAESGDTAARIAAVAAQNRQEVIEAMEAERPRLDFARAPQD